MGKYGIVLCLLLLSACAQFSSKSERFLVTAGETVLDEETGLMWAAADNGQSLTWPEAEKYCSSYTGGGYDDWRLPRRAELIALYQAGIKKEEEGIITLRGKRVWAAETDETKGAGCSFESGGCGWSEKMISIALSALPVRDTKVVASPVSAPSTRLQTPAERLKIIDQLHRQQLITKEEYEKKKAAILDEI